ncbi:MAG: amino acid ABC transporter substrate-binding protein [Burkholderiales bacterium]
MASPRCLPVLLAACLFAGTAAAASPTLDRIKASGTVTFGYRDAAAPFSARQRNGQVRGYSVELCQKVAAAVGRALGMPDLKVAWRPVDGETRITDVVNRRVDAECGTTTITLSRQERVDFSLPIFVDGGSVLVRAGKDAPTRVADLAGKRIAVMRGTTTEGALARALALKGATYTPVPVKDGGEGVAAVLAGTADAYASDRLLLTQLKDANARGADLAFVQDDFSFEPYALVLPRDDPDFRLLVNRTLAGLYKSGEIDPIFIRWLAPYGSPGGLLNAMFYLNSLPE